MENNSYNYEKPTLIPITIFQFIKNVESIDFPHRSIMQDPYYRNLITELSEILGFSHSSEPGIDVTDALSHVPPVN